MLIPENNIKVIVADDSAEFLEGILLLLSTDPRFEVIATYSNGLDLVNSVVLHEAHFIFTDIEMPGMNGIDAARRINFKNPNVLMVAMTMYFDKVYLEEIISAGFKAFIHKPDIAEQLFDVIESILNRKFVFPHNLKMLD